MDRFEILHKYNTMVRRGLALPLTCNKDNNNYTVRLNDGVTPMLRCWACGGEYFPSDHEYMIWHDIVTGTLR